MATLFDIGLIGEFRIIFPFLLIFAIVYALLSYSKIFGEGRTGLNALIAIVLAFMSLFSEIAIETINTAAPWFVLLIIFGIFLLLGYMIIGIREADILAVVKNPENNFVLWWIFALVLIIMLGSLSQAISAKRGGYPPFTTENATLEEGEGTQESAFWETMFHPKILGLVAIMLIAFITVNRLTHKPT
jgi:hypothetical protein